MDVGSRYRRSSIFDYSKSDKGQKDAFKQLRPELTGKKHLVGYNVKQLLGKVDVFGIFRIKTEPLHKVMREQLLNEIENIFGIDKGKLVIRGVGNKINVNFTALEEIKDGEQRDWTKAYISVLFNSERDVSRPISAQEVVAEYNRSKVEHWVNENTEDKDKRKNYYAIKDQDKNSYISKTVAGLVTVDLKELDKNSEFHAEFEKLDDKQQDFLSILNQNAGKNDKIAIDQLKKASASFEKNSFRLLIPNFVKAGASFDAIKWLVEKAGARTNMAYRDACSAYLGLEPPDFDKAKACAENAGGLKGNAYLSICGAYLNRESPDFDKAKECAELSGKEKGNAYRDICEGYLGLQRPDYEKAKECAAKADKTGSAYSHMCSFYLLTEKLDFDKAQECAELAGRSKDSCYTDICVAYLEQENPDFEKAKEYSEKAGDSKPLAYYAICKAYLSLKDPDFEKAKEYAEKSGDSNERAYEDICRAYLRQESPDFSNAIAIADKIDSPDYLYRDICRAYLNLPNPDFENAAKIAKKAGTAEGSSYLFICKAYLSLENPDFENAVLFAQKTDDSTEAYRDICRAYLSLEKPDFEKAAMYADKAGKDKGKAYRDICRAYLGLEKPDFEKAAMYADKAGKEKGTAYRDIFAAYIKHGKLDDLKLLDNTSIEADANIKLPENLEKAFSNFVNWNDANLTNREKALQLNVKNEDWIKFPFFNNYAKSGLIFVNNEVKEGVLDSNGELTECGHALLGIVVFRGYLDYLTEKVDECLADGDFKDVNEFLNSKKIQSLIKEGPSENDSWKNTITDVAKVVYERNKLHEECQKYDTLKNIPKEELYKLVIDGRAHMYGPYGFENEKGYLAAMFNGLRHTLQHSNDPLSATHYDGINKICLKTVTRDMAEYGFRNKGQPRSYGIDGYTEAGYKELVAENDISVGRRGENLEVWTNDKTKEYLMNTFNELSNEYSKELEAAKTDEEKITAIVKFCQKIERRHFCCDGNIRTSVFCVMNMELVKQGLNPTMFNDPNDIDGHSVEEMVVLVKDGQKVVEGMKG